MNDLEIHLKAAVQEILKAESTANRVQLDVLRFVREALEHLIDSSAKHKRE